MTHDYDLPLTVLDNELLLDICAKECGSKCCDFYLNDFHARVNLEDYKRLKKFGLDRFVIWDHGDPQLAKQPGGTCIFLHPTTKQCSIYSARPLDCRNFPYFMPEENIADHCLLYYRSSKELILSERAKTHDVPGFTKTFEELTPAEKEYIGHLQDQPSLDLNDTLEYEEILSTSTSYISIIYSDDRSLDEALKQVEIYQDHINQLTDPSYRVLSILGMNTSFNYQYHIHGVIRTNDTVELDRISSFPQSTDTVDELLNWVNHHDYLKLIAGISMDETCYQDLENRTNI